MTATTFDPNFKSASGLALSGGNLTATATAAASVAATRACSGPTYFQITLGSSIATAQFVGLVTRAFPFSTTNLGADSVSSSIGYDSATGTVKINNATVTTIQTSAANAVVDVAYNPDQQLIWFRTNNGNWNNSGTANPATNTGGISTGAFGPLYPAWGAAATGNNATAIFTSGFTNTPPSGYITVDTINVSAVVNSVVARRTATFTQYGAAKNSTVSSPHQISSFGATRGSVVSNAWYGGIKVWSPAGVQTNGAGTVAEGATLVGGKVVFLYDLKTGLLLGSALSTVVTGAFSIPALGRSQVFAVAFDPTTYQMIGFDRVTPV